MNAMNTLRPSAPEVRQNVAHGVSRGTSVTILKPRRGDRKPRCVGMVSTAPTGLVPAVHQPPAHDVGYCPCQLPILISEKPLTASHSPSDE